jgi:hypothetical protein
MRDRQTAVAKAKHHPELIETGKAGHLSGFSAANNHVAVPMRAAAAQCRGEVTPHIPRDISVRLFETATCRKCTELTRPIRERLQIAHKSDQA